MKYLWVLDRKWTTVRDCAVASRAERRGEMEFGASAGEDVGALLLEIGDSRAALRETSANLAQLGNVVEARYSEAPPSVRICNQISVSI
jgi:hypothetical protein